MTEVKGGIPQGEVPEIAKTETMGTKIEDIIVVYEEIGPGVIKEDIRLRHHLIPGWKEPEEEIMEDLRKDRYGDTRVGFQFGKQAHGSIRIGEQFVPFTTPAYDRGPTTWIDAEVHTISEIQEELVRQKAEFEIDRKTGRHGETLEEDDLITYRHWTIDNLEKLIRRVKNKKVAKAVKTRKGGWYAFNEGDTIVSTKP